MTARQSTLNVPYIRQLPQAHVSPPRNSRLWIKKQKTGTQPAQIFLTRSIYSGQQRVETNYSCYEHVYTLVSRCMQIKRACMWPSSQSGCLTLSIIVLIIPSRWGSIICGCSWYSSTITAKIYYNYRRVGQSACTSNFHRLKYVKLAVAQTNYASTAIISLPDRNAKWQRTRKQDKTRKGLNIKIRRIFDTDLWISR